MRKFYIKQLLVTMVALLCSATASAYDFEVDGIYYNISSNYNVTVTYKGSEYNSYSNEYSDVIVIPSSVKTSKNRGPVAARPMGKPIEQPKKVAPQPVETRKIVKNVENLI